MRRNSKEYLEGYNSGYAQKLIQSNPYNHFKEYLQHSDWLDGYYQGYYDASLGTKGEACGH